HHQVNPGGRYNWDVNQAGPLFTTMVDGRERDLVTTVGQNGVLHILDRDTRELVYTVPITSQKNVDAPLTEEGVHVCPGHRGGTEWNGPAYNPGTNMLYTPAVDWCSTWQANYTQYGDEGQLDPDEPAGVGDPIELSQGWLTAANASTGEVWWRYRSDRPMIGAVATTSGNLVLTGELTGDFLVLHARTGDVLYRFNTGSAIGGGVITYRIDGKQYIAVMSGNQSSGWGSRGAATAWIFSLP
ncbi:MAG: PQQ-binding-like beta-propeller repeat protein, partial [Actinomycetota bacterium]